MTKKKQSDDYQELSGELDEVVSRLQSDDISIDEAVKAYERGMELIAALQDYLKSAENTVKKVKARFDQPAK